MMTMLLALDPGSAAPPSPLASPGIARLRRATPGPVLLPVSRERTSQLARGFTLIEIMVVVTILGILAALIVPRVIGRTDDARVAAARQDIAQLMQALKLYRLDNGRFPSSEQGLRALVDKPSIDPLPTNWKAGGYLDSTSVRKDPWGNEYQYLNPGLHGEVDVLSFGRDGQPGGEGPDADIGSWSL